MKCSECQSEQVFADQNAINKHWESECKSLKLKCNKCGDDQVTRESQESHLCLTKYVKVILDKNKQHEAEMEEAKAKHASAEGEVEECREENKT